MTCEHPITLAHGHDRAAPVRVPCGSCTACRIAKARVWATRCVHESAYWEDSVFCTLTYDDEHLPKDGNVSKKELQLFLKRLRKEIAPRKIRYYMCGEYGEKNGRPHYHALIFGMHSAEREVIQDAWRRGFVSRMGTVEYDSARYVADYVGKSYGGVEWRRLAGRVRPFQLMSQGLGKGFADEFARELQRNPTTTIRGVRVQLPRYYLNRIKVDPEKLMELSELKFAEKAEKVQKRLSGLGLPSGRKDVLRAIEKSEVQSALTQKARLNQTRKGNL